MVILVEETIKEFGYSPDDLAPQSQKKIVVICDECGELRSVQKRAYSALCRVCTCQSYEFRSKISIARKGMVFTEEHKRRIGEAGKGRKHTKEQTEKISRANRGKHRSKETCQILSEQKMGARNPMFGKHHTDEAREKIIKNHAHLSGENHPNYGKHLTDEAKQKLSLANKGKTISKEHREIISMSKKGRNNPMFGRKGVKHPRYGKLNTEATRRKISKANKGRVQSKEEIEMRKRYYNEHPEAREAARVRRRSMKIPKHHTKPELIFEEICKSNNLPFHFVGDSQLWIGKGRKKLNPDFCELNGKKVVVEVLGDYWHSPLLRRNTPEYQTLPYRKNHYEKYGWIPVFIWESDLVREDVEQFVLNLLKKEGVI